MPQPTITKRDLSSEVKAARRHLRRHGWTQVAAARELGVSDIHLCYVLNDRRVSKRLLDRVRSLPENPSAL